MQTKPDRLQIVNFVCLAEILDTQLDLIQVAERTGGKYGKRVKQAVVIRSLRPKLTCMIMANGKMLICGGKSPDEGNHLAWLMCLELQKHKLVKTDVSVSNFVVHNIVCTYDCGFKFNVPMFYAEHTDSCIYHPRKIRPVRHYINDPRLTVIIFPTGKAVITGATHQEQLYQAPAKVRWTDYKLGHEHIPFDSSQLTQIAKKPKPVKCTEPWCKKKGIFNGKCKKHDKVETKVKLEEQETADEVEQEMMEALLIDKILCSADLCCEERALDSKYCKDHA